MRELRRRNAVSDAIVMIEGDWRVHKWSLKKNGFHDWIPPSDSILNIWGLAFDADRVLAVGGSTSF